jgi:hypothetical protein
MTSWRRKGCCGESLADMKTPLTAGLTDMTAVHGHCIYSTRAEKVRRMVTTQPPFSAVIDDY